MRLAQEQGYLTYSDINDTLPEGLIGPEELDDVYVRLRNLEVEIVDQAEVDRIRQPEVDDHDEKTRLDILDDPVRMYLKQMGQVPLLTREQEVEISMRIEEAEIHTRRLFGIFGFSTHAHLSVLERMATGKERFDRVISDKHVDSRERYMKILPRVRKTIAQQHAATGKIVIYSVWQAKHRRFSLLALRMAPPMRMDN